MLTCHISCIQKFDVGNASGRKSIDTIMHTIALSKHVDRTEEVRICCTTMLYRRLSDGWKLSRRLESKFCMYNGYLCTVPVS